MGNTAKRGGFFSRKTERPEREHDDAADLGTCIGLDASLDTLPWQPEPEPQPAPARAGWRRLLARNRSTDQ